MDEKTKDGQRLNAELERQFPEAFIHREDAGAVCVRCGTVKIRHKRVRNRWTYLQYLELPERPEGFPPLWPCEPHVWRAYNRPGFAVPSLGRFGIRE